MLYQISKLKWVIIILIINQDLLIQLNKSSNQIKDEYDNFCNFSEKQIGTERVYKKKFKIHRPSTNLSL